MKTLVALIVELDRVFDEKARDGHEPIYVRVGDRLIALENTDVVCEYSSEIGRRIVLLQGEAH